MAGASLGAALLAACVAAACLSGCNVGKTIADDWEKFRHQVEKEWDKVENITAIQRMMNQTTDAFLDLEEATKKGTKEVKEKALEEVKAMVRALYAAWKDSTQPLDHEYVVPPTCLLAMAVGGGAVVASSGLALAALGFAEEGVEAASLAALWQGSLGDVEAGSIFARLQSLGAKSLSIAEDFKVTGIFATISACFCGVVNNICHHCISGDSEAGLASDEGDQTEVLF